MTHAISMIVGVALLVPALLWFGWVAYILRVPLTILFFVLLVALVPVLFLVFPVVFFYAYHSETKAAKAIRTTIENFLAWLGKRDRPLRRRWY